MDLPELKQIEVATRMPVFWCGLNQHVDALIQARLAIDEVRVLHPDSTPSNVQAVYMSPWHSHLLTPRFQPLISLVEEAARTASRQGMLADLERLNLDVRVSDCWGAIYEGGDYTHPHHHFPSAWSVVVYLEAEPGCAPIVFGDGIAVKPVPGLMVMFPGNLLHAVPATAGRRVCAVMNLLAVPCFREGGAA
ncbi:2OG-Fe(II) oxygenase family protein [Massilia sp. TS11]|uniref:2OG-Fe(II) oxygenase family protein n=1 Tax=Massilia sp. TS11 TaxID=2908003 RepID=UPI001ED9EE20|nr:2OG-Fe(II) oxygenase family protein [Massilia sp. TS11]MCG2582954.1 2OG-Fe(II) oxygenase family protein [Massilia sp. TS11]